MVKSMCSLLNSRPFSRSLKKGIVDKFCFILNEAKSRMFDRARNTNERPWCSIEPQGTTGMGLFASVIISGDGGVILMLVLKWVKRLNWRVASVAF